MAENTFPPKKVFACFLDMNDRHPELFGDCILPRDDDGMGFDLSFLDEWKGKEVIITIEERRK
jgi:hypothetical protein